MYVFLTTKLYCLKKIYAKFYYVLWNEVVWILPILAPVELTMYLRLSRKYYVAAVSSERSSKTFERREILGTRMGHTICRLIIPVLLKLLQKRQAFSESPIYSGKKKTCVIIGESLLSRIVLLMNKREWNGNMVGMYGAIYRFCTILLMRIYRKTTKVQVKIVLNTSLEHILSTIILILICLLRYFFLILVCLLMSVRKSVSVKLRLI